MVVFSRFYCVIALYTIVVACMPAHLKKYQRPSEAISSQTASSDALIVKSNDGGVSNDSLLQPIKTDSETPTEGNQFTTEQQLQATIVAQSENTFKLAINDDQVWNALIEVLMKNYNLTLVDRQNGLITTEWDSYYLDNTLYRNKLSIRLTRNGRGGCEMSIHNNVELASEQPGLQGIWLPAPHSNEEQHRVVRNIALMLRQPEPLLNAGIIANSGMIPGNTQPR